MYGNTHILVTEQTRPGGKYGDTCGGSDGTSETPSCASLIACVLACRYTEKLLERRPDHLNVIYGMTLDPWLSTPLVEDVDVFDPHSTIRIVLRDIAVDLLQTTNGISNIVS